MSKKEEINIDISEDKKIEKQEINLLIEKLDKLINFKEEDIKKLEEEELKKAEQYKKDKKEQEKLDKENKKNNEILSQKENDFKTELITAQNDNYELLNNINDCITSLNLLSVILITLFAINIFAKGWLSRGH